MGVAQVHERDFRRAVTPVAVGDGDQHAARTFGGERDVLVGIGVLVAFLGAAARERHRDPCERLFADGADFRVFAAGEQDGLHAASASVVGRPQPRRRGFRRIRQRVRRRSADSATGRPPIRCSCTMRSSASGVQPRYQTPSG